jgi:hypothetical protein
MSRWAAVTGLVVTCVAWAAAARADVSGAARAPESVLRLVPGAGAAPWLSDEADAAPARADAVPAPTAGDLSAALVLDPHPVTLAARTHAPKPARIRTAPVLNPQRGRILLRSLTFPGWGQATLGHRHAAAVFALAEASVWTSFTAFRVQEQLRTDAYIRTARLAAGIDLSGRDEDIRRIVGAYASSDEYNQLVVYRDAANLYYNDPVAYRQYIADHQLTGRNTWDWASEDDFRRYRGQRKDAQRAALRSNTALALAFINRLVSTVHAMRESNHPIETKHAWNFECVPVPGDDATAFHVGVRTRF